MQVSVKVPSILTHVLYMLFRSSIADGILTSDEILVAGCLIGSWALAAACPLLLQLPIFLTLLKHYPAGQPRPKE